MSEIFIPTPTKVATKALITEKNPAKALSIEKLWIHALTISTPLAVLALVKYGCRRPKKHSEYVNIMSQSDV